LPLLYLLSDKLEPIALKKDDISKLFLFWWLNIVMKKGDEADAMYIIYHGEVGIFFDIDCIPSS